MKKYISYALFFSLMILLFSACGGGGDVAPSPGVTYTERAFKVNLTGDLGDKAISGLEFTITLPDNVIPDIASNTILDATGVVVPVGTFANITPYAYYTPATDTTPGTVKILITSNASSGVTSIGEIAKITLKQLNNGSTAVLAKDFGISAIVKDLNVAPILGLSPAIVDVTL